jgi:hypothetical protein
MEQPNNWKQAIGALTFMIIVTSIPPSIIAIFLGYYYQHGWIGALVVSAVWVLWQGGPLLAIPVVMVVVSPWYLLGQWLEG